MDSPAVSGIITPVLVIVAAIVIVAGVYFLVTSLKDRGNERRERELLEQARRDDGTDRASRPNRSH